MFVPPAPIIGGKIMAGDPGDKFRKGMLATGIISLVAGVAALLISCTLSNPFIFAPIIGLGVGGIGFGLGSVAGWFALR